MKIQLITVVAALTLSACAAVGPAYQAPAAPIANHWQAALPHGGKAQALENWWAQFNDPVLSRLLQAAHDSSPTLAQAAALIEQARAALGTVQVRSSPTINGRGALTRSGGNVPEQTVGTVAIDAAWEIDLFGSVRRRTEAAKAQLQSRQANWHDARISLAAEVASQYVNLRGCEQLLDAHATNAMSLSETARLSALMVQAGVSAPVDAELTKAATANGESIRVAQQAQCDLTTKALVTLTGLAEPELRAALQSDSSPQLPKPASLQVTAMPAAWVSQRPDLRALERTLANASANMGVAAADRYPRLSISGSLSVLSLAKSNGTSTSQPWSFGPSLSLPLLDGGAGDANERSAAAQYAQAQAAYESGVRRAVEEVERALINLDSVAKRDANAEIAAQGFASVLQSTEARWRAGAANAPTLELARRDAINARIASLSLKRDQVLYWIALYKALGGGWSVEMPAVPSNMEVEEK